MLNKLFSKVIAGLLVLLMSLSPTVPAIASGVSAMVTPAIASDTVALAASPLNGDAFRAAPSVDKTKTAPVEKQRLTNRENARKASTPIKLTTSQLIPISYGATVNGTLTTSDPLDPNYPGYHFYIDPYVFNGTAGDQIAIAMNSTAFDTYLELYRLDSTSLTYLTHNNDLSSTNTNSRVPTSGYYTLPTTGKYVIFAGTNYENKTGAYTLQLVKSGSTSASYSASGTVKTSSGTAVSGVTMTFTKVSGTGTTVPAAVTSTSAGTWSQTGFASGTTYKVTPTKAGYTFSPSYITISAATTAANFVATPATPTIALGEVKSGTLAAGDSFSQYKGTGYYADKYTFYAAAGTRVAISLSSLYFDPYLFLKAPNGSLIAYDDSSGDFFDALVPSTGFYTLPYTGTYTIEATSANAGQTGPYTLNLSTSSNYMASGLAKTSDSWTYKAAKAAAPLAGAVITFTRVGGGTAPAAVTADSTGKWAQKGFVEGANYRATPSKAGYTFSPATFDFNSLHSQIVFTGSPASTFAASGKVTQGTAGVSGATMTFTKVSGSGSVPPAVTTDASGNWSQKGFAAGTTYKVTPSKSGLNFSPSDRTFNSANTALNFTVATTPSKAWTFIVYGAADNDLNSYMTGDMNEMLAAGYDADVNVVMLYDGYDSTGSSYKVLTSSGWVTKATLSEVDTGNPATLTNFLNWVKQNYPAQQYALDLWNHGGGFKYLPKGLEKGIGWDYTNSNNFLTMPELRTAIATSTIPQINLIGTDACLMAMVEVAYELKNNSSVFVASEQTIPGNGWPYTPIINALDAGSAVSATSFGNTIVNSYVAAYTSNSQLSLTNQSKVSTLASAVNSLANVLKTNVTSYRTKIDNARNASQKYADASYVDLYDFTLKLDSYCAGMSGLSSATAAVRTALTGAVIANKYTSPLTGSHGLTIWMPALGTSSFSTTMTNLYKPTRFAADTQWDEFLESFMTVSAYSVSGKITTSTGTALTGATVTLGSKTATTDASGNYSITGVTAGTYTLSASKSGYNTASKSITVNGNLTGQNLALTPVTTTTALQAIGGGVNQSISQFNGKKIYAMISAQPTSKPEGYGSPSTLYDYNLITQAATSSVAGKKFKLSEGKYAFNSVYAKNQLAIDEQMRQQELKLLASKAKQFDRAAGDDGRAPSSISVGTQWNNVYLANNGARINTTCRYISNNAYFFVDNRNISAMESYLASYGAAFDQIFLTDKNKFGSVNDVDHNGKVIIVFSQELSDGLLGFFWGGDKYSTSQVSNSNQGDIFYMTTTSSYQGNVVKGTLAHELQHMIFFDQHYNNGVVDSTGSSVWLNEALSQAAEYYNGYLDNHHNWIRSYLNGGWGGLSLTHWTSGNYGYGAIFVRYLIDQYGDTAIKNMCSTKNFGVKAVEAATGADFNVIYDNFTRALVMSGTGDSTDPKYNFKTLNLQQVQPSGRGGLTTTNSYISGDDITGSALFPYRIFFSSWTGNFGTMNLSGNYIKGTAFGLSR